MEKEIIKGTAIIPAKDLLEAVEDAKKGNFCIFGNVEIIPMETSKDK